MRIFIIGGKSGCGKNELATMIKNYYDALGEKSVITAYSKYIKLYAMEMLNWDGSLQTKPRKFLQEMGEEIRKNIAPNFFIKRMQEDILIYQKYFDNIIIADARLIPEFTLMKAKYPNCYTIHLICNRENNLTKEEKNHITEKELENYTDADYNLTNTSLTELKIKITKILEEIS
jgi:hypothetical protein